MANKSESVAFIGLGAMGSRMAKNVLGAGYTVRVWNRSAERIAPLVAAGAIACKSPADAARAANVVVLIVADDDASRAVMTGPDGVLAGAAPGTVVIDATTATPAHARAMAAEAAKRGVAHLDAPVLGSLAPAEKRELVFVIGGESAVVERVRPVFESMGRLARHVGPSGAGATLKLINNSVSATLTVALAEAAYVAEGAGVDPAAVLEILGEGATGSRTTRTKLPKIFARDFSAQFQLGLMEKDVRYCLSMASAMGRDTPMFKATHAAFRDATAAGFGTDDVAAVFRLLERRAVAS